MGDNINSLGATFKNPLVLLHQHNHEEPIGSATFKKPTSKGIEFSAEIPVVDEPGQFKDRCDTAWGEISYGVIRAVSVGFKPIKYAFKEDGGIDFQQVEIYELSIVSVPALPEAVITAVKSMTPVSLDIIRSIRNADALTANGSVKLIRSNRVGSVKLTK
jgi:HK97 family phage prohead protease